MSTVQQRRAHATWFNEAGRAAAGTESGALDIGKSVSNSALCNLQAEQSRSQSLKGRLPVLG